MNRMWDSSSPVYVLGVELDLEDSPLDGLRKDATPASAAGHETVLDDAYRALHDVPDTGYRVFKGYGLLDMALWRVRFISVSSKPSWYRGRSKFFVTYEMVEALWQGPNAKDHGTRKDKDGNTSNVFRSPIEEFDMSLTDAVCKMRGYRDKYRQETSDHILRLRQDIREKEAYIEEQTKYLASLDKFNPEAVVPSDILDDEDRAVEEEIARVLAAENS